MQATQFTQNFTAEERRQYIGASDIAAIMGLDSYKTPLDLYNQKRGLVESFTGNNHTERGTKLEAVAAAEYSELTGINLRRKTEAFVHPDYPFIVGHIDRIVTGTDRIAEIKCPSVAAFRKLTREGLPKNWIIQAQVYLGLSGRKNLTWIIFCADLWEIASFDIEFDAVIYAAAIDAAAKFWFENVQAEVPPVADKEESEAIELAKIGGELTVRDDPAFAEAVNRWREAIELEKEVSELKETARIALLESFENEHGRYYGNGATVHYTETKGRVTFDKKLLAATHPELDLSKFEKTGKPSNSLRVYFAKS